MQKECDIKLLGSLKQTTFNKKTLADACRYMVNMRYICEQKLLLKKKIYIYIYMCVCIRMYAYTNF